jgi:hypothetical protein
LTRNGVYRLPKFSASNWRPKLLENGVVFGSRHV